MVEKEEKIEPEEKAIVKEDTRVLTPRWNEKLREELTPEYIAICDVFLHTGMRKSEIRRFAEQPGWYDARRRCIELPRACIQKGKTVYKTHQVNLTLDGCKAVEHFQKLVKDNLKIPTRQSMVGVLRNAAIRAGLPEGDRGICPKMYRKTMVSWLMFTYPELAFKIANNMGHDLKTMNLHYTNLSFAKEDADDIKKFLKGWGMVD